MTAYRRATLGVLLAVALAGCDSTEPDAFPNLIGRYSFEALFRDALATDIRAAGTLMFTHVDPDTGQLVGQADVSILVNGQPPLRLIGFDLANVTREGDITFRIHLPDLVGQWNFTGSVSPSAETMHGNHTLATTEAELLGTWSAGRM
jgi:hypothetical protein